jgi:hypothetical protein
MPAVRHDAPDGFSIDISTQCTALFCEQLILQHLEIVDPLLSDLELQSERCQGREIAALKGGPEPFHSRDRLG